MSDFSTQRSRPGSATAAGALGITFGVLAAGSAVFLLLLITTDGNGFGLFGLPVLAFGVGLLRNGYKVLAGVAYSGDRLGQLATIPAVLAFLGIGGMVAGADWSRDESVPSLAGFIIALLLAVLLIVLCDRPATKAYLQED
ncbi:hypothetical protein ABT084_18445 [Streptomyces sp. NPDC002138]|uniref:hypothetical protein n=1 Tax=Streptomyces sp. NPDC002138 TaxID=3154410 RepID=UPI0033295820